MDLEGARVVRLAFAGIAATLVALAGVGALRETRTRSETREVIASTIARDQLTSRLTRDVDRMRLLVDLHILQSDALDMAATARRIDETTADFATAARAYDALPSRHTASDAVWLDVQRRVASVRAPIARAVDLSRRDRNAEARALFAPLDAQFRAIDAEFARLTARQRADADAALAHVGVIQRVTALVQGALAAVGIVFAAVLGAWATRIVRARDAAARRHAEGLEERNRELDAFAGRVAHDLRGPLSTLSLGITHPARHSSDEVRALDAMMQRAVGRMESLIADLLLLSRVGAEAHRGTCDPESVAAQLRDDLAARGDTSVEFATHVSAGRIACRETLVRQALWNLLENAVKYRQPERGARIELSGRVVGAFYEWRVKDNGLGIAPEDLRQAFQPFYRARASQTQPGTGLGLSIVKRVVDACGGTIAVESALGVGTSITLQLPRAMAS